jgi:hypothetical protein
VVPDRLTVEEQRLVGKWRLAVPIAKIEGRFEFEADHWCEWSSRRPDEAGFTCDGTARWSLHNGVMVLDNEPNFIRRVPRPLQPRIGLDAAPLQTITPEVVTADEFILVGTGGYRQCWTRDRGD